MTTELISPDTSLLGEDRGTTGTAIDAASFMPAISESSFTQAIASGAFRREGFSANLPSDSTGSSGGGIRGRILSYAKQFIGVPYVWGGTSPSGFDCSGLLQYTLKQFGVHIPRVAAQQAGAGERRSVSQLQPGDFVVRNDGGHIAFYLGDGMILEAPRTGLNVRIRKLNERNYFGVHMKYPGE